MRLNIYQVDAFTNRLFGGNPAAVCPLQHWLEEDLMQKIAMENNLAETVFYVKEENSYTIRWFTPTVEVDLCGHATLAAAYVLFEMENHPGTTIVFYSPRSGNLSVTKKDGWYGLNFPADRIRETEIDDTILACFNLKPVKAFRGNTDYMLLFEREEDIQSIVPDFAKIALLNARGLIITAKGNQADFVSRFFAPQSGVNEDPVTGSAHTTLIPYWANVLGKDELNAIQLSARGGFLRCKFLNERVEISGQAKLYLVGEIYT